MDEDILENEGLEEQPVEQEYTPEFQIEDNPSPTPAEVTFTQEQVTAMIEQERQRIAATPAKPEPNNLTAYDEIKSRAEKEGWSWDTERVNSETYALIEERAVQKAYQRVTNDVVPMVKDTYIDHATKKLVGDDPTKQEFAQKWVSKGIDVSNPDIQELISLASEKYAEKKRPTQIKIERGGLAPTVTAQDRDEVAQINAILMSVNPKAAITDDDIKAAKAV